MNFEKVLILTGIEARQGKNGQYVLFHVLDESGKGISLMYKGTPIDYTTLKKLQQYKFNLEVTFGKFTNVVINSVFPLEVVK